MVISCVREINCVSQLLFVVHLRCHEFQDVSPCWTYIFNYVFLYLVADASQRYGPIVACKVFLALLKDIDDIGLSPIRWDFVPDRICHRKRLDGE